MSVTSGVLLGSSVLCMVAALLHFACLFIGSRGYRMMGAGEKAVRAVEAGDRRPHISATAVGVVLVIWSLYALSGAQLVPELPHTRLVLFAIAGLLLARALAFPLLKPMFPGNSRRFWLVSSLVVGILGLMFLVGALGTDLR